MKRILVLALVIVATAPLSLHANTFMLGGQLASEGDVEIARELSLPAGLYYLRAHTTIVPTFKSPTTSQEVLSQQTTFSAPPSSSEERVDVYGNRYAMYRWDNPPTRIRIETRLRVRNRVDFPALAGDTPFPPKPAPEEVRDFTRPSPLAQSEDAGIVALSRKMVEGARAQHEAVGAILNWVADHVTYTLEPAQFDALYALRTGQGNCQNFSNLSVALLRAAGIPARVAMGWSTRKSWSARESGGTIRTLSLADGRHAWLEVYDPTWGWLPYDAQQTLRFVSTRYIRVSVGFDSGDDPDGVYKWSGPAGKTPSFRESIQVNINSDQDVATVAEEQSKPMNHLFAVSVGGAASPPVPPVALATPPSGSIPSAPPVKTPSATPVPSGPSVTPVAGPTEPSPGPDLSRLTFNMPLTAGNLKFPVLDVFGMGVGEGGNRYVVESAEYVTGKEEFAQAFDLAKPTQVQDISLAIRRFGGQSGHLWLELVDDVNGAPGGDPVISGKVSVATLPTTGGYQWVAFPYSSMASKVVLTAGRYWMILHHSGDAVCNWFYIYGNPYGSPDGTRSRKIGDMAWNTIRNYDFNYRIRGAEGR